MKEYLTKKRLSWIDFLLVLLLTQVLKAIIGLA